ncbi:MAG: hypothetical protein O9293_11095 [Porphyrobacter sp.]|nr:hypothetical protein [Porphyrobacter sp.]
MSEDFFLYLSVIFCALISAIVSYSQYRNARRARKSGRVWGKCHAYSKNWHPIRFWINFVGAYIATLLMGAVSLASVAIVAVLLFERL